MQLLKRGFASAHLRPLVLSSLRRRVSRASSIKTMASATFPVIYFKSRNRGLDNFVEGDSVPQAVTVYPVVQKNAEKVLEVQGAAAKTWATAAKFKGKSGEVMLMPDAEGNLSKVLVGLEHPKDLSGYAALASKLPAGAFRLQLESDFGAEAADQAALAFVLGSYNFDRYKRKDADKEGAKKPQLVWPEGANRQAIRALASAYYWARDMINTPAEDFGPQHIAAEAEALAQEHGASIRVISGEELLRENYPAIHMVGRASYRPPVLVDLRWSSKNAGDASKLPLLALVGKGVCFDSGGLNIKTAAGMKGMKKDMGGAALVLALSHLVMSQQLPVRLRLLIPAVENSISGNAYRPSDVLTTRAGIFVENGNTDAEGRLILCDALYEASTEQPDLILDAATLTGARGVALGPDLPAVYSSDDAVWSALESAAAEQEDHVWRLPLHKAYRKMLDSKVADISSTGSEAGQAGSIVAALYLQEFVKDVPRWIHVDTPAANNNSGNPGRPEGGEATALRALWTFLRKRYSAGAQASA